MSLRVLHYALDAPMPGVKDALMLSLMSVAPQHTTPMPEHRPRPRSRSQPERADGRDSRARKVQFSRDGVRVHARCGDAEFAIYRSIMRNAQRGAAQRQIEARARCYSSIPPMPTYPPPRMPLIQTKDADEEAATRCDPKIARHQPTCHSACFRWLFIFFAVFHCRFILIPLIFR